MNNLTEAQRLVKNDLHSDGCYLVLLTIDVENTDIILNLVRNTEDIVYKGVTYTAFPFELSDVKQTSDGEIPSVNLQVSNVNRIVQSYVEKANGGGNSKVKISVVNSKLIEQGEDAVMLEEMFTCIKTTCNENFVTFNLGLAYKNVRRPLNRYMKNYCSFTFGSCQCGVSEQDFNTFKTCNHTLTDCRARHNATRFGGFPMIQGGLYI